MTDNQPDDLEELDELAAERALADRVADLRRAHVDALAELREAIRAADQRRNKQGRNQLARAVFKGLSRTKVYEIFKESDQENQKN